MLINFYFSYTKSFFPHYSYFFYSFHLGLLDKKTHNVNKNKQKKHTEEPVKNY